MDISKFTVEDFIYNSGFRRWVLKPDIDSNKFWDEMLLSFPDQAANVTKARQIILRMDTEEHDLSKPEIDQIWDNINAKTEDIDYRKEENKIIPIHSRANYRSPKMREHGYRQNTQFLRIAAILVLSFGLGMLAATVFDKPVVVNEPKPVVFEEHKTLPGVKSYLTLSDGSKVILNSGSSVRYAKGFDRDKREIFLEGEAFFDVFRDEARPFVVKKGEVSITALGTSFNVQAYGPEQLNISLVSGKVGIALAIQDQQYVFLEKGESLHVKPIEGTWDKGLFNKEEVLAWTKKIIIFNKTPVSEAVRILENWYGIPFHLENKPGPGLLLSGRFEDETLENVLQGLSYTTDLEYKINNGTVIIRF